MRKPREIINQLSPQDALAVLKALAASDANLARHIAEIATEHLSEVDPQDVAEEVYYELESLQVENVWDRSGSTRYGYVEPYEIVDEMIDGAMTPYFDELVRYQKLKMDDEAMSFCKGLLSGLYRFEYKCKTKFREWAPDYALSYAEEVLGKCQAKSVSQEALDEMNAFIQKQLPKWQRLQRLLKYPRATRR
jgi:hypothetical protein